MLKIEAAVRTAEELQKQAHNKTTLHKNAAQSRSHKHGTRVSPMRGSCHAAAAAAAATADAGLATSSCCCCCCWLSGSEAMGLPGGLPAGLIGQGVPGRGTAALACCLRCCSASQAAFSTAMSFCSSSTAYASVLRVSSTCSGGDRGQ
jgi:hypothetical protein